MHTLSSGFIIAPRRAGAAVVVVPGGLRIIVASVYLHDVEGLSERNTELLSQVGAIISHTDLPVIVGGDFNMTPGGHLPQQVCARV
eukprot:8612159-Pyramimonas_sp.AAC.1